MPSVPQSNGQWLCKPCKVQFPSWEALFEHKKQLRQSGAPKHICCEYCGQNFKTAVAEIYHVQRVHAQAQMLECPGCGSGPFVRMAGLIAHIEHGKCSRIDSAAIDERRADKTEFARSVEWLTKQPVKNNFSKYICSTQPWNDGSTWAEAAATRSAATDAPFDLRQTEFPELSGHSGRESLPSRDGDGASTRAGSDRNSKCPRRARNDTVALPGSEGVTDWIVKREPSLGAARERVTDWGIKGSSSRAGNATTNLPGSKGVVDWTVKRDPSPGAGSEGVTGWGMSKDPSPGALAVQRRPAGDMVDVAPALGASTIYTAADPDHPDHPAFDPARYYCTYAEKFICPKLSCGRAFKDARGLKYHLWSPAHGCKTYTCPYCLRRFKSLTAITSHAEQSSSRCRIRESTDYDAFVDQLTAGVVDVSLDRHVDGTVKYETPQNSWRDFHGSKAAAVDAKTGNTDQDGWW